jgi:nucleotide-binding universal stress UspA family protein
MRYVVGYSANERGRDAVHLAVALARHQDAALDLVIVVPEESPFRAVYPPEAGYESILGEQVRAWLDEGLALVPDDVEARAHVRSGASEAAALIDAAEELAAGLLVIGATATGLLQRFSIGSVASALLHASTIPVALAPAGYARTEAITRLTCGVGARAGAQSVLEVAASAAQRRNLPLRLVSLLALDIGSETPDRALDQAWEHAARSVRELQAASAGGLTVDAAVASGPSIEDAVGKLDWDAGEVLLIGSSRLARSNSIFLGSTANRILRALPVPMIVVPLSYVPPTPEAGEL